MLRTLIDFLLANSNQGDPMSETELYRAINRVTGESIQAIQQRGFQLEMDDGSDSDGDPPSPDPANVSPRSARTSPSLMAFARRSDDQPYHFAA